MVSDTVSEGIGALITIETDEDGDTAVDRIRKSFTGIIYYRLIKYVDDGKTRIGISIPSKQTLNDIFIITERLKIMGYTILAGNYCGWEYKVNSAEQ